MRAVIKFNTIIKMGFDAFLNMTVSFNNGFQAVALTIPEEYKDKGYENLRGWVAYLTSYTEENTVELYQIHEDIHSWDTAKELFEEDDIEMTEDDYKNFVGFINFLWDFQEKHEGIHFEYSFCY
jgi:hypothetical protein